MGEVYGVIQYREELILRYAYVQLESSFGGLFWTDSGSTFGQWGYMYEKRDQIRKKAIYHSHTLHDDTGAFYRISVAVRICAGSSEAQTE